MTVVFLDTSPCIDEYRTNNPKGWDPCSTQYPTCSINGDPSDPFEGECHFYKNIMAQNCTTQFEWLKTTMAAIPKNDWVIVVGHHPLHEVNVEDFTSVLNNNMNIYLNGHAHTLSQYSIDGNAA